MEKMERSIDIVVTTELSAQVCIGEKVGDRSFAGFPCLILGAAIVLLMTLSRLRTQNGKGTMEVFD